MYRDDRERARERDSSGQYARDTLPRMIGGIAAPEVVVATRENELPLKRAD